MSQFAFPELDLPHEVLVISGADGILPQDTYSLVNLGESQFGILVPKGGVAAAFFRNKALCVNVLLNKIPAAGYGNIYSFRELLLTQVKTPQRDVCAIEESVVSIESEIERTVDTGDCYLHICRMLSTMRHRRRSLMQNLQKLGFCVEQIST